MEMEGKPVMSDFNAMYLAAHPEMAKKLLQEKRKQLRENRVIVMSLKPKYAKAIYEGRKNWEFRKAPPPLFKPVLIYESAPISKITGIVMFSASITGSPLDVHEFARSNRVYTKNSPGISLDGLYEYAGKSLVTALRVCNVKRFDHDVEFNCKPPQNWGAFQRASGASGKDPS